jgi:hypothetical protein
VLQETRESVPTSTYDIMCYDSTLIATIHVVLRMSADELLRDFSGLLFCIVLNLLVFCGMMSPQSQLTIICMAPSPPASRYLDAIDTNNTDMILGCMLMGFSGLLFCITLDLYVLGRMMGALNRN